MRFLIGLLLIILASVSVARADQQDIYTVRNVAVDIVADNAVTARDSALREAGQIAFDRLAERLTGAPSRDEYTAGIDVNTLIRDYSTEDEKLTTNRYKAVYTFRFNGEAIQNHLAHFNINVVSQQSPPVLVLAFYQLGASTILWGERNIWSLAWQALDLDRNALVPLRLPIGDVADMQTIDEGRALDYDARDMADLLNRYRTNDAVVTIASSENYEDSAQGIDVYLYHVQPEGRPRYIETIKTTRDGEEDQAAMLQRAARDVYIRIQSGWKTQQTSGGVGSGLQNALQVRVPINDLQDWIEIRNTLKSVKGVQKVNLKSLKESEADVAIETALMPARLNQILDGYGYMLAGPYFYAGSTGSFYMLEKRGSL